MSSSPFQSRIVAMSCKANDFGLGGHAPRLVRASRFFSLLLLLSGVSCNSQPAQHAQKQGGAESDSELDSKSEASDPPVLFDAPKFKLTDQNGQAFGANELRGRVWIADFMFTRCTATCPRQTAR